VSALPTSFAVLAEQEPLVTPVRVLVLGAGGIGLLVAGKLAADPQVEVVLVVRQPTPEVLLTVAGDQTRRPVGIVSDPGELEPVDWVVVATKAYDVDGLKPWFASTSTDRATVVAAHAGIDLFAEIAAYVAPDQVMPALVTYAAERSAPGAVTQRRDGVIRVPDDQHGQAFAQLAGSTELAVEPMEDFLSAAWERACWTVAGDTLSTIVGVPLREVGRRPELVELARTLVQECQAVAESQGAVLEPGLADTIVKAFSSSPKVLRPAMLQDRDAGRRFEHDAVSGSVIRAAELHGVAVPVSRVVTGLLQSLSPKVRPRVLVPTLPRVWCAPTSDYGT
jgi:2-dehydropantoate 2-reductase